MQHTQTDSCQGTRRGRMRCAAPLVSLVALVLCPTASAFLIPQHHSHHFTPAQRSIARQHASRDKCSSATTAPLHMSQPSDRFPRDRLRKRSSSVPCASMRAAGGIGAVAATTAAALSTSVDADVVPVTAARNEQSAAGVYVSPYCRVVSEQFFPVCNSSKL